MYIHPHDITTLFILITLNLIFYGDIEFNRLIEKIVFVKPVLCIRLSFFNIIVPPNIAYDDFIKSFEPKTKPSVK
jgi:hypothetical protein